MSNRKMPQAELAAKPGVKSDVQPSVLMRWNPDIRAATKDDDENTISILDIIGQDWFGDGVTAKRIRAALRSIGKNDVTVLINSPGGDFFEGLAIYNLLRDHPAQVTVKIMGMAASAASVIAMAGDDIQIARAGFLMIHNVWVIALGDKNDLREVADWLEPFDESAIDIYAARSGMKVDELRAMMDKETWIGGSKAIEMNLADELLPADQVDSKAKQSADAKFIKAEKQFDRICASINFSVAQRRELMQALRGDKPGAVTTGKQDAAVAQGLEGILELARSI
ncbi:MAG: Clp protease ClpP [Alphaproteobacteria bacterium]|nr:Clp protease ClpP [Alphaproteobacteria bacterium]